MPTRIIFSLALFSMMSFLPFYFLIIFAIIGMFLFKKYYEALFILVLADLLFGTKQSVFLNIVYVYFTLGIILFFIIEFLKKKLRYYKQ